MPSKSIVSQRLVYLTAASASAATGIARIKLTAEMEPVAWLQSTSGEKLFPLYDPADVDRYAEQVATIRANRTRTRTSIPAGVTQ